MIAHYCLVSKLMMTGGSNVGIIGSGKVGKALGSWFAAAGFSVLFTSRAQEHAKEAAQSAGHNARSTTIADLVQICEIVLLTVPYDEVGKVLEPVRPALAAKTFKIVLPSTPYTNKPFGRSCGNPRKLQLAASDGRGTKAR